MSKNFPVAQLLIFYFYTPDNCSPNDTYICKNAGVCKITKTGAASCTCNKEYAGESCEVGKYIFNPNAICYILFLSTMSHRELINAFNN